MTNFGLILDKSWIEIGFWFEITKKQRKNFVKDHKLNCKFNSTRSKPSSSNQEIS